MGDLATDTAVEKVGDGRYRGLLSREWEIWGPMGGYIAAFALRAAAAETKFGRPAAFTCHYLGVAAFEAIDAEVTVLRPGRSAESLRVTLTQGGRPMLEALVWAVDEGLPGLDHDVAEAPDVPGPDGLPYIGELLPPDAQAPFRFWENFECRPLDFRLEWPPPEPLPPVARNWYRFVPTPAYDDPWIDVCRALIMVDVQSWPAGHRPHAWKQPAFIAPSLDLSVSFHHLAEGSEWLLMDGYAPVGADGLMGWNGRLWTHDRRLWASGGGQMLCRPIRP